jgi:arylformamidase
LKKLIDISVSLKNPMPTWPGSIGFRLESLMGLDRGDEANVSRLDMDVHTGTHVDAPHHFVHGAPTVETLNLETLMGTALVVELPETDAITAQHLTELEIPSTVSRLLFHTRNSQLWQQDITEFQPNFVALTADAAQWIVDRGIALVGVDYLSVQRFNDSPLTHEILLTAGVIVIEGLNLTEVQGGFYQLICLPLKIAGAEGAPARAILLSEE